ncbi:MAG: hypothetical protein KatS3mg104_3229 [Phycisphaerae bacterium]|nr:MAG: hypothetical protein KatS3mg104_3229 [Phycisphaerae bacterium]
MKPDRILYNIHKDTSTIYTETLTNAGLTPADTFADETVRRSRKRPDLPGLCRLLDKYDFARKRDRLPHAGEGAHEQKNSKMFLIVSGGIFRADRRGQSIVEYAVVLVVFLAALLSMQIYIKRGIQGRWRDVVDGIGEQYDPAFTNATKTTTLSGTMTTDVWTEDAEGGFWTMRQDVSNTTENTTGSKTVMPMP